MIMRLTIAKILTLTLIITFSACQDDENPITIVQNDDNIDSTSTIYFPPMNGLWESTSADELGWDPDSILSLYTDLESNGTRAFIVLHNGRIVLENYWGKTILGNADFDAEKIWYWASAAKTLTALTVGKAQEDGHLSITDKTSDYIGSNWTSLSTEQEDKITIWHQLTMTTGLDDASSSPDDTSFSSLTYVADAGTRWAYHNGPYTLLESVVKNAVNKKYSDYFNTVLRDKIGMTGYWQWSGLNHLYLSNARSAARFGILMQNNGNWEGEQVVSTEYTDASITKSQNINNAYGYLWWLNGSSNYRLPQSQILFSGSMLPNAPSDTYSAMGKNGQYISISPSAGIVIIRMGENPDNSLVPLLYLDDIWKMMNGLLL
jgi:CubicO group peptidase (beta-lactamase class C family)